MTTVILDSLYCLCDPARVTRAICDSAADADALAARHAGWSVWQVGASRPVAVGCLLPGRRRGAADCLIVE